MSEETKEKPKETTTEEPPKKTKAEMLIENTNAAVDRMEAANTEKAKLLDREEALNTDRTLAGNAEAGGESQDKKETPEEYAKKIMSGEDGSKN
ncbi:MAG: hypothetical protein IIB81_04240 [Nanoarchaeota archaeon]|nr:hypothetical protein [Nanoarchaeota archaeon]